MKFEIITCKICNKPVTKLGNHLYHSHKDITFKEYYDRYLKTDTDGICVICGKPTEFNNKARKYQNCCSDECRKKYTYEQTKIKILEKYGVENPFQSKEIMEATYKNKDYTKITEKIKETCIKKYGKSNYSQTDEYKEKIKKTINERYGVDAITQSELFKEKSKATKLLRYGDENYRNNDKIEKTCIERYGFKRYSSTDDCKKQVKQTKLLRYGDENFINKEKIKQTCLEKYGTSSYMSTDEFKCKTKEFYNKNYNVDCYAQTEDFKEKERNKAHKTYESATDLIKIIREPNKEAYAECRCLTCNRIFKIRYLLLRVRFFAGNPICTYCNPINSMTNTSGAENKLYDFISSIYPGNIIRNDRTVLSGKELDIYLPEKKIAFEFDGLYWHNEVSKPNSYHVNKTDACENAGIHLIHIFEDDWLYKQDIVKSRIKSLLGLTDKLYARKCELKEVSGKDAAEFLNMNHLQGSVNSRYRYGLYHDGELVSLMTFGKSRFDNNIEMHRFCNKRDITVVGSASRLFKYFMKTHPEISTVESFADRCWSTGNLYEKIGFEKAGVTKPAYYYVIDNLRHNRMEFQKHKLVKEGFDPDMTEHEIMLSREIYRIYDCGNIKYIYTRK